MHSRVDGRGACRGVAVWVVHHVLSVRHDVRVNKQCLQVLDVGACELERVDLGEFPGGWVCRYKLAELVKGGVDGVHPLALSLVGCCPLPQVLVGLNLRLHLSVLVAALIRAGAARAPAAGAPVVGSVAVLASGLVPTLTVGGSGCCGAVRGTLLLLWLLLRRAGLGVVVVGVSCRCGCSSRGEGAGISLRAGDREAGGRVAQTLHRRAHDSFLHLERLLLEREEAEVRLLP